MSEDSGIDQKKEERVEQQHHPLWSPWNNPGPGPFKKHHRQNQMFPRNQEILLVYYDVRQPNRFKQVSAMLCEFCFDIVRSVE